MNKRILLAGCLGLTLAACESSSPSITNSSSSSETLSSGSLLSSSTEDRPSSSSQGFSSEQTPSSSVVEWESSSSEISSSQESSSSTKVAFKVLLKNFPKDLLALGSHPQITWSPNQKESNLYTLQYKEWGGEWITIAEGLQDTTYQWITTELKDNARIQIQVLAKTQLGETDTDETVFFDVSDGLTPYTYNGEVKALLQKYCAQCHMGGASRGGLSINNFGQVTENPNTPSYLQNRFSLIKDMPTADFDPQPTEEERKLLRDWVLGGYPEGN